MRQHQELNFTCDFQDPILLARSRFYSGEDDTGIGSDMKGWLWWADEYLQSSEYADLQRTAQGLQGKVDDIIVVGIGGSDLGTRAIVQFMYGLEHNGEIPDHLPRIHFTGDAINGRRLLRLIRKLNGRRFAIIYISKSGTTTEPAMHFRKLEEVLINSAGEEASKERIFAITDGSKGTLHERAVQNGWKQFVIPDDIGGRYSWLTAVGLFPCAVVGIDTDSLLIGAQQAAMENSFIDGFAIQYARWRQHNYATGKIVEIFALNDPDMEYLGKWYKQLFAESHGKDGKGIIPYPVTFSTDLHSVGQQIQEGERVFFETQLIMEPSEELEVGKGDSRDELDYLMGKSYYDINLTMMQAARDAHVSAGVPCSWMFMGSNEMSLGYIMMTLMIACYIEGYSMGINPGNQNGVEAYKRNMFTLNKKPGYEKA